MVKEDSTAARPSDAHKENIDDGGNLSAAMTSAAPNSENPLGGPVTQLSSAGSEISPPSSMVEATSNEKADVAQSGSLPILSDDPHQKSRERPLASATDQHIDTMEATRLNRSPPAQVIETSRAEDSPACDSVQDRVIGDASPSVVNSDPVDENGSVSMSDGASDDYEPAEPEQTQEEQVKHGSEPYEPADANIAEDSGHSSPRPSGKSESSEATQLYSQGSGTLEIAMCQKPDSPKLGDDADFGVHLTDLGGRNAPQIASLPQQGRSREVRNCGSTGIPTNITLGQIPPPVSHFTPYETARRYFKDFRYHDQFSDLISDGYKSLTFSNDIDPKKPFCPTELLGGDCQEPGCQEQHFRQVALTGAWANHLKAFHDRSWPRCPP